MPSVSSVKLDISKLSEFELEDLQNFITEILMMGSFTRNLPRDCRESRFSSGSNCPHCHKEGIVKHGKVKGRQRFRCKTCGKTFNDFTLSPLSNSKLSLKKWVDYAKCILLNHSIRKSADIVGVGVKTSFYMRHKLLDALRAYLGIGNVSGIIEMDETFLPESFKGNHKKSGFLMPRKSRKRGKEIKKRGISREQVCIATAIDRGNNIIMEMVCKGRIGTSDLDRLFSSHLANGATICTDSHKSYISFARKQGAVHVQIKPGQHKSGIYHLAHINSLHSSFKGWIKPFKGVSTKFLANYIHWFKWLQNFKAEKESAKTKNIIIHCTTKFIDCRVIQYRGREPAYV